jgi:hypothetical protein
LKRIQNISTLLFILCGIIFSSCIDENQNLVNPPSNVETVNIRFINLGGNNYARNFVFNGTLPIENTNFAASSNSVHPPADSAFLSVSKSGVTEFSKNQIVKFSRNINYSYFALPSPKLKGDTAYRDVDTLIALTTSLAMPKYSVDAYIKLFNAVPDSLITYSLIVGGPNAQPLIQNIRYRECSVPSFIRAGRVAVTVMQNSNQGSQTIGTFALNLESKGQYSLVTVKKNDESTGIYLLDENDLSANALIPAELIKQQNAEIRLINLSSASVSVRKEPNIDIATDKPVNFIDNYKQIITSTDTSKDHIEILNGNNIVNTFTTSLEVLEKYSLIIADSADFKSKSYVLVPPSRVVNLEGKSLIRVVNLASNLQTLDLSIASRSSSTGNLGYSSGTSLAKALKFANISQGLLIEPGELPLTLFTTYSPVEMLYSAITKIEANKEYLIVITNHPNSFQIHIIENTEENKTTDAIKESSFIQIINSIARSSFASLNINNKIPSAKVYFANTIATNLPAEEVSIDFSINDKNKNIKFTPNLKSRYTLILTGDKDDPDYVLIENKISPINKLMAEKRFINASKDFQSVWEVESILKDTIPSADLIYKDYTPYNSMDKSKKYTFYFFNPSTKKLILNYSLDVTLGKRYSLIFTGTNKDKFGYSIIQVQEY